MAPSRIPAVTVLCALLVGSAGSARAQLSAGGLGTRVNGTALGRCNGGVCRVQGGTASGDNLFHRFSQFDLRKGIRRVDLDTRGRSNVVVGVSHPEGSFFGAPFELSEKANLFWLSPGGIWLGKGSEFLRATNLLLSTSSTLRFGNQVFDAVADPISKALHLGKAPSLDLERLGDSGGGEAALTAGNGPIVLGGGRLTIDRNLLIDSGVGPIRSETGGGAMAIAAGGSIQLSGGELTLGNLTMQAGNDTEPGMVNLRVGAVAGGAPGPLRLKRGALRGGEIVLQGAGGVQLQQVEARATSGAGKVEVIAGTSSQPATTELRQVSLEADRIDVRATGAVVARDLQAFAPLGAGSMTLMSGLEDEPGQAGSLRLDNATLQAGSLMMQAFGPMDLEGVAAQAGPSPKFNGSVPLWIATTAGPLRMRDVSLVSPEIGVKASGDLHATNLQANAHGIPGQGGNLWLFSSPPKGQPTTDTRSLALNGGWLQADQLVVQVEGGRGNSLDLRNLKAVAGNSTAGGSLWLINGTVSDSKVKPDGPVVLEGVDLKGSEVRLEGTQISVSGSSVSAPGQEGLIKLQGLDPGAGDGAVAVRGSTLKGQAIVARTNGALALEGVKAQAGIPGERGVILLEGSEDLPGSREHAQLRDVDLQAKRIVVRSGAIQVDKSQLQAPKGMIHLEANTGDLEVNHSTLDVGVKTLEDLTTPVSQIYKVFGVQIIDPQPDPSIGLFALKGNLRIANQSQILANQNIEPMRQAFSTLRRDQIRLTDTSGVVVGDAGNSLHVTDSVIRADASDNLAGNVILRSQGREGEGGLSIERSSITASGGAGSGDLRFSSANGMRIERSTLMVQSTNSPANQNAPGKPDWRSHFFSSGEITLTNSSTTKPLQIIDSHIMAEQSGSGGIVLDQSFTNIGGDGMAPFSDPYDSDDKSGYLGGRVSIVSTGGLAISGNSLISVDSKNTSATESYESFGGVIRLVNISDVKVQIEPSVKTSAKYDLSSPPDIPDGRRKNSENRPLFQGISLDDYFLWTDSNGYSDDKLSYILLDPSNPADDSLINGPIGFAQSFLERRKPIARDRIFPPDSPPITVDFFLQENSIRNPNIPRISPDFRLVSGPLQPSLIYRQSEQSLQGIPRSSPLTLSSPQSANSVSLVVEKSEMLSPSAARETFVTAEQSAKRHVGRVFGLEEKLYVSSNITFLQLQLQKASTQGASIAPKNLLPESYVPAILQISTAASPTPGKEQITQVLIPASGEIQGWQSQVETSSLREAIRTFQLTLSQEGVLDSAGSGQQLARLLLAPVIPELRRQHINALILSLDRNLQGIPFAALPLEAGGTLIEQVALTVTPSLGFIDLRSEWAVQPLQLILLAGSSRFANGMAPLPMAPEELRQVASLHPGSVVLLDDAFQSSSLVAEAQQRPISILHLATHADFVNQRPNGARIFTSHGDFSLSELGRQLQHKPGYPIELFVLNACRTAIGNEERELGISGLALQAGAKSALGNLWFVDDSVSAAFAVQFHRLLQQGWRKDQALQETQKRFREGAVLVQGDHIINQRGEILVSGVNRADQMRIKHRELSHPYFWAGAVLSGSPW